MKKAGCITTATVTTTQLLVGSYRTIPLAWPAAPTRINTRQTHQAGSIRWDAQNDAAALAGASRMATNHHRGRRATKVTTSFRTGGPKRTRSRATAMAQHQRSSSLKIRFTRQSAIAKMRVAMPRSPRVKIPGHRASKAHSITHRKTCELLGYLTKRDCITTGTGTTLQAAVGFQVKIR